MVGYLPSTTELYAIARDYTTLMVSEDGGTTWVSVSTQRYAWAKGQPGYQAWTRVPWETLSSAAYITSGGSTTYEGMELMRESLCRRICEGFV